METSPTGIAWLPKWFPQAASALVAIALAVKAATPSYTIANHIADGVLQVGVLAGITSQGVRK
jgi:hypothetical protein